MARERTRRKAKSPNEVGAALLRRWRDKLTLEGDVEPFLEDAAGRIFIYNGRFWQEVTQHTLLAEIFGLMADDGHAISSRHSFRAEVVQYLRAVCHRMDVEWARVGDNEVPCNNGVVDVTSGAVRPHRAEDFLDSVLPWDYKPGAPAPILNRILEDHFPSDGDAVDERADALQLFFGYVVLPHARYKKALLLYSDGPDFGKSLYAMLLKELVGARFTCSLAVDDMADPVKRAVLVGKRLNLLTELPADAMIADGGFKTLVSTEEPVLINPKYERPVTYTPAAKHVIATNTMPRITDKTEATISRLLVIPFTRKVDKPDRHILDKLKLEMPGILNFAIAGAERLVHSGGEWPEIRRAKALLDDVREQANPIRQFVAEMMIAENGAATPLSIVTGRFNKWKGGGKGLTVNAVGRALRKAFGDAATGDAWQGSSDQKSARCFLGYKLGSGDLDLQGTFRTDGAAPPADAF